MSLEVIEPVEVEYLPRKKQILTEEQKKRKAEYMKKYRQDHKDEIRQYKKEWRKNNKDKLKEQQRRYRHKHYIPSSVDVGRPQVKKQRSESDLEKRFKLFMKGREK